MGIDPGQLSSAIAQLGNIGQGDVTVSGVVTAAGFSASGGSVFGPTQVTALVATGTVTMSGLPTSEPAADNQVWSNTDVLNLSAGAP